MRRLWSTLRAVPIPHADVGHDRSPSTPSYPSSPRLLTSHPVFCDENDKKYSRQQSIQFMVSRELIIRGATSGQKDFRSQYTVGNELGTGAFGRVWSVCHKASGQVRAAKEIKKKDLGEEKLNIFEAEVEFLTKLDHPNVVRLIEFFKEDGDNSSMYLILELCQGPDLFDHIADVCGELGAFGESRASVLLRSMLKAVLCCHCNNIVHRDIKPENFMFPTKNLSDPLKMIDLGLSDKFSEGKALSGVIGTVGYMAPEVVKGKYSRECDIWSLGVILFMMLTGRSLLPMEASEKEVERLLANGTYIEMQLRRYCRNLSEDARSLLSCMLMSDPSKRITAEESLRHPFIRRYYELEQGREANCIRSTTADYTKMAHMLEHYARQSMLKRASLLLLAHMADEQDPSVRASQHAFRVFDADGNGELTTEEINDALKSKGVPLPPDWPDIIRRVDVDAGGTINFVEWTAATLPEKVYSQERYLRAVFQFLDVRKVGEVTSEDIVVLFPSLKRAPIESQQKVILSAIGKPSFTFADFKEMMLKNPM